MIITGTEDLRVQKTMAAIAQAFSALILETDYERISVKAVCERAKVNKKTFYHYYPTLHDLLCEMMYKLSMGYISRIAEYKVPEDLAEINREFFLYSAAQGELYEKIVCCSAYHAISAKMLGDFVKQTWTDSPFVSSLRDEQQNILFCFLRSTGTELYRQWVADGKKLPLDEIIAISSGLLCNGICGFIKAVRS